MVLDFISQATVVLLGVEGDAAEVEKGARGAEADKEHADDEETSPT